MGQDLLRKVHVIILIDIAKAVSPLLFRAMPCHAMLIIIAYPMRDPVQSPRLIRS